VTRVGLAVVLLLFAPLRSHAAQAGGSDLAPAVDAAAQLRVDAALIAATAAVIRSQIDTVGRLTFVPEQNLRDRLRFADGHVAALRGMLPETVLIANEVPLPPCTNATGLTCTQLAFEQVVRLDDTWRFTLSRSPVRGCGHMSLEIDVRIVNRTPVITESRYAGSGSCGVRAEPQSLLIPPRATVRPPF
jgi:hypothetical protein